MPEIGEHRSGYSLGKTTGTLHIWVACIDCGKERWVQVNKGKPKHLRCNRCAKKGERHPYYGKRGEETPNWKGGQYKSGDGYVMILKPTHPRASCGYVKRAILVLEQKLGRPMLAGAESHHINGIKDDDRPENLEELTTATHAGLHDRSRTRNGNGRFAAGDYQVG